MCLIFKLICNVLNSQEEFSDSEKIYIKNNLKILYAISKKHDIAHLVGYSLISGKIINKYGDEKFYSLFNQAQMMAIYRYEKINYAFNEISNALEENEIEFIPLKGAILREYYPEPWMRTSCDIDILVRNSDIENVIGLLCKKCCCSRGKDCTTHDYNLVYANEVHLELHYSLTQDGKLPQADEILCDIWEYSGEKQGFNFNKELKNEIFILYHLAHMAKHFLIGGCGIRSFIDLTLILRKMEYDTVLLNDLIKRAGLTKFYESLLILLDVWLNNAEHTVLTLQMENFILTGGVYGTARNSAAIKAGKGESKLKTLIKLIFLSRENLEIIYPKLKKHPNLLFFYQIKRWFNIFNRDKRKKIKNIVNARKSVKQQEINLVGEMIKQLEL